MTANLVTFDTDPARYKHWKLAFDGPVATLALDVQEDGGLRPGYKLKLNSYDLGVDIELHDALQRVRFEHPEVKVVVVTSAKDRVFCAGANIAMLGTSSHGWKVNFCKFTNETRNGIEDMSANSGLKSIAAVNGVCAGGGYELALACDEILLVDDRSSAVSLPEVPLLGVLPGTGGLTRVTDKRKVRRDLADVFCTTTEGVKAERAKEWKLVDDIAPPAAFKELIKKHAEALAKKSDRPANAKGVTLTPLERTIDDGGYHYKYVDVAIQGDDRIATITVRAPADKQPDGADAIVAAGVSWWPLQMARELDDAILLLRVNNQSVGTIVLKTAGDPQAVLAADTAMIANKDHWFVRETINMLRRTLSRLDVSSRSLFAVIDRGSCFAGTLAELALAADRSYMLDDSENPDQSPRLALDDMNFGPLAMASGVSRVHSHFQGDAEAIGAARAAAGKLLDPKAALALGLVTFTPDDLDWDDEIRIAVEERASLSPDALTGMEASLRFGGEETMLTKVFGRLTAWQNWIFIRPNAVGEKGALKLYGTGSKPSFNWERV
jgi:benzoyl-CoA-dihydrodiol lyase